MGKRRELIEWVGGLRYDEDRTVLETHAEHKVDEVLDEVIDTVADWLASVGEKNAAYLLRSLDIPGLTDD